ncbi:MAG: rod shape-determining protein, partial [Lachnospiraceae bacterium]|nr:rod shape-determining protein [Lachnospiraceae bacterium]
MTSKENDKYVFGLDIGTRSVVGTVGYFEDERFKVVCQRSKEHETRSMIDGQIHDIPRVATAIKEVKEQCEAVIGEPLNRVCIAAAGRVLKTINTHVDMIFEEERETKPEDVTNLQLLGVEKAYKEFQAGNTSDIKFYCVGYSVIKYYIDKLQILNLVGHKAKHISADMIATFLPDDVVDGLYKAVDFAGLEVLNLTLEPIAAMSVAIPERFRMLNLALVDVGAGTSDISITDAGSIIGYGMIPMAGDSLTDELARHYLADFYQAEKIKRGATNQDTVEFEDIMGIKQTVTSDDVAQAMAPKIDEMTTYVSDEIKRLNGDKSVSAVFVVGGGGMAKGFTDALADKLGLVHERVALRGSDVLGKIDFEEEDLSKSPLMVTPIGICLNYYENNNNLIYTFFNGTRMKLYDNGHVA